MAAPDAPANVLVKRGLNPQSVRVSWDASVGADSYSVYCGPATGISSVAYKFSRTGITKTQLAVENLPAWRNVFATVTATNGDGTSADATEASGVTAQ